MKTPHFPMHPAGPLLEHRSAPSFPPIEPAVSRRGESHAPPGEEKARNVMPVFNAPWVATLTKIFV
jgi:hypothetical protein